MLYWFMYMAFLHSVKQVNEQKACRKAMHQRVYRENNKNPKPVDQADFK